MTDEDERDIRASLGTAIDALRREEDERRRTAEQWFPRDPPTPFQDTFDALRREADETRRARDEVFGGALTHASTRWQLRDVEGASMHLRTAGFRAHELAQLTRDIGAVSAGALFAADVAHLGVEARMQAFAGVRADPFTSADRYDDESIGVRMLRDYGFDGALEHASRHLRSGDIFDAIYAANETFARRSNPEGYREQSTAAPLQTSATDAARRFADTASGVASLVRDAYAAPTFPDSSTVWRAEPRGLVEIDRPLPARSAPLVLVRRSSTIERRCEGEDSESRIIKPRSFVEDGVESIVSRRNRLLDRMETLLPSMFEAVAYRAGAPVSFLKGSQVALVERAIELLVWAELNEVLDELEAALHKVIAAARPRT
ncbi:MAG: hypothetical protein U0326_08790 [Polyangiales bacterium]